jgi:hypothetical protein
MVTGVAERVAARFDVGLFDVGWVEARDARPVGSIAPFFVGEARQIVPVVTEYSWFDSVVLEGLAVARNGRGGAACAVCGTWKWPPVWAPPVTLPAAEDRPVIESPEWFGYGRFAVHKMLVVRELAELLVEANPRSFTIERNANITYV